MKKSACLLLVFGILITFSTFVMGQKKVLHLKMDEEHTSFISDISGKDNDARIINLNFVPDRFGNECRALQFDGSGYLTIPHDPSLNLSNGYTLSAWVKLPPKTGRLQWLTLICKGEQSVEHPTSPAFRVQFTSVTASVNTASTKTIGNIRLGFPVNRWFHIAVTYDNHKLRIYQDGFEIAMYTVKDNIYDNNEPLNIGRDIPGATEFFSGIMDDLILWDGVLSHKKIIAQFKNKDDKKLGTACPPPPSIPNTDESPDITSNQGMNKQKEDPADKPVWNQPKEQESNDSADEMDMEEPDGAIANIPSVAEPPPPPPPAKDTEEEPEEEEEEEEETPRINNSPQSIYSFDEVAENNLVLLLDVSGSMEDPDKLPMLKATFLELIPHMRQEDIISIVAYSGGAQVVLNGVSAKKEDEIRRSIEVLASQGNTKAREGLIKAFSVAKRHFKKNGNNRIILATDGNFRILDLYPTASEIQKNDIFLSVFSFGAKGPLVTEKFDKLARLGGGNHTNIVEENIEMALLKEVKAIRK